MLKFKAAGFTLIELLVTLVILGLLVSAVIPLSELSVRRNHEKELRTALWQIRSAIDAYKKAADDGRIQKSADESGYPPTLESLVDGVKDTKDASGSKIYFLRHIPRDPFADSDVLPVNSWGKRSYESPADRPQEGRDVFDVYSLSEQTGLNNIPYKEW